MAHLKNWLHGDEDDGAEDDGAEADEAEADEAKDDGEDEEAEAVEAEADETKDDGEDEDEDDEAEDDDAEADECRITMSLLIVNCLAFWTTGIGIVLNILSQVKRMTIPRLFLLGIRTRVLWIISVARYGSRPVRVCFQANKYDLLLI